MKWNKKHLSKEIVSVTWILEEKFFDTRYFEGF